MTGFTYHPAAGVYRDAAGAIVPDDAIRASLDALIQATAQRLAVPAAGLAQGTLDTLAYRTAVQAELKTAHTAVGLLAHGGRAAMGPSEHGWLGGQLRAQYTHLATLALSWSQGRYSAAQLGAHTAMYASALHSTYEGMRRRDAPARGQDQERNVQGGSARPCAQCIGTSARGWVPLGTLPAPGSRTCLSQCRCRLEYRRTAVAPVPVAAGLARGGAG